MCVRACVRACVCCACACVCEVSMNQLIFKRLIIFVQSKCKVTSLSCDVFMGDSRSGA